jgi:hypothetical protein
VGLEGEFQAWLTFMEVSGQLCGPDISTANKNFQYPQDILLCETQGLSGLSGEKKHLFVPIQNRTRDSSLFMPIF